MLKNIMFLTMLESSKFLTMLERNKVPHNVGLYSLKILHCEDHAQDLLLVPDNVGYFKSQNPTL